MVMEAEISWYPVGKLKIQDSQWYKSQSKNSKSLVSSSSSEAKKILPSSNFLFFKSLKLIGW